MSEGGIVRWTTVSCPKCHVIVHLNPTGNYKELNAIMEAHWLHSCKELTKKEAEALIKQERARVEAIEKREAEEAKK